MDKKTLRVNHQRITRIFIKNYILSMNHHCSGFISMSTIHSISPVFCISRRSNRATRFRKIKSSLYSNQVFVTDEVKDIVPEFLMLLQGVIDSPDIPLNVSRSYLQGDPNVKKINNHITKKVADKLEEIFQQGKKGV